MTGGSLTDSRRRLWVALLFGLANLAVLLPLADRDGYEGDDLNSILPMAHLDAAKHGLLEIYRYAWQPLSYEMGTALWRLFGTPDAIFLSAPIAGATTLGMLLWMTLTEAERIGARPALAIALIALVAVPEFWFSALFYNSTMPGMPFAAAALLLLRFRPGVVGALAAGLLFGVAILMRADFILIAPLLAMASWRSSRGLAQPLILAGATGAALAIGWAAGLVDFAALAEIQRASAGEIAARAHEAGWDRRMKLGVFSICLAPVGWLLLIAGGPLLLIEALRRDRARLLWIVAALPTVYPLLNILSPKYMLPLALLLPLLFIHAQAALLASGRWVLLALSAVAVVPVFLSTSFFGHRPFVALGGLPARPVGTHDGERGYGGYLWTAIATDGPAARTDAQRAAHALALRWLAAPGPDLLVIGKENYFEKGAIGWRHLQLELEERGIHGQLIGPHELNFIEKGRTLTLTTHLPGPPSLASETVDLR